MKLKYAIRQMGIYIGEAFLSLEQVKRFEGQGYRLTLLGAR